MKPLVRKVHNIYNRRLLITTNVIEFWKSLLKSRAPNVVMCVCVCVCIVVCQFGLKLFMLLSSGLSKTLQFAKW